LAEALSDRLLEDLALRLVGQQDHDDVARLPASATGATQPVLLGLAQDLEPW